MKKLLFAFMLGVFAIFALPSCSGGASEAADKIAGMELTKDNAAEWVETFNAAIDDCTQALKDKDEAKANAIAEKLSKAMDVAEKSDVLTEDQKMAIGLKVLGLAGAAQEAGIKLE